MSFPEYPGAENYAVPWGHASERGGTRIDTILVHVMVGSYEGSMRWAQQSPNISFHYGVAQDGRIGQGVSEQYAAWHAGNWNYNLRSIGIEHEDKGNAERAPWMTEKMFDASTRLAAHLCEKYDIGPERIIPHRDVASDGRTCPGPYFDLVAYRDRVNRLLSGAKPPSAPALYRVVAGTFEARAGANQRVAHVKGKGFEAGLVFEHGYFRVLAGSFKERAGADQRVKALKAKGIEAYVLPTVKEASVSNTEKAIAYGLELNKHRPKYWCWDGGSLDRTVGGRPGCVDGPPPPMQEIKNLFCADLTSLMLRAIGKPVPKNGIYPGGTRAFKLAYGAKMVPFKLSEFRRGDVAFVDFQERGPDFEGHIGVSLDDGPDAAFLQSFARNCRYLEPGLNADYTLRQSHDGGFYTHRLPREAIWG